MAGINFVSGLASGFDWATMIDQLMKVEGRSVDVLEGRKGEYESKLSAWQTVNTRLLAFKGKAEALSSVDAFNIYRSSLTSSSSTDPRSLSEYWF